MGGGQVSDYSAVLADSSGSVGEAIISGPGSKWTSSTTLYVGYKGSGTMRIEDGAQVSNEWGSLGESEGATGTAIVTGVGSTWTNSDLHIGDKGSGMLRVEAGGQVSSSYGYLGRYSGSTGTATITGVGSKWTNSLDLSVGYDGTGSLTVSDGGVVSAKTLYASIGDLHGNGTITVQSGAYLDGDLIVDATVSAAQTLPFGTGGTLQLPSAGTGTLGVGRKRSGSLRIADGRSIASATGYLGCSSGSTGTATIAGTASKWSNSGALYVGYSGGGMLCVDAGGQVSGGRAFLGHNVGATGTAVVTGAGSQWTNSAELNVGQGGTGTLRVEAGGQVSNANGYLGYNSGSTGTAIITGAGSKWTNSRELYVGYYGRGSLTVSDGGVVSAKTLYASLSDLYGNGTIQSGAVLDGDVTFDATQSVAQTLAFGSGGTLQLNVDGTGDLGSGYKRSGSLRIADGRLVTSYTGYLGYSTGSAGTATITGAGSKWRNSWEFFVGRYGSGSLQVEAGGQVSSSIGYIGYGSTGSATITGAGSKWTNSSLYVGYYGSGKLTVADGGTASAQTLYASLSDLYGDGTITASGGVLDADLSFDATHGLTQTLSFGSGGTFQLTADGRGDLGVGYRRSGSLRIADGCSATSLSGYLGYRTGSAGTAVITGAGSKWTNSNYLFVGSSGRGTLTVSDGAQVTATNLTINSQSTVRLHVSGDGMLVLGNASTRGSISNSGKLSLLADAFLPDMTYRPIAEYPGKTLSWSGSGSISVAGGTWDSSARTFTVGESARVDADTLAAVSSGQRLLITDPATGERAGISFGILTSPTSLTSLPLPQAEQAALLPLLASDATILSAWRFTGQLAGDEALLSFDIGLGEENLRVWRRSSTGWSEYTPDMLTYDSNGIVSFTVDPASLNSAYAVSGIVPEPAALSILALAAVALLRRRPLARG